MKMSAKTCLMVWVAVAVCLPIAGLQAGVSTWNAGGGGANTWTNAANWDVGVPAAGDTALFTGSTNSTVTIDASNPTIDTINVSGAAQWVFAGTFTLNVATAFNYSDSYLPPYGTAPYSPYSPLSFSRVDALLAGSMSLTVSSGGLDLDNAGNTFSGGIYINGGTLAAGKIDVTVHAPSATRIGAGWPARCAATASRR